tara:strand:- start:11484 stop:12092 length:609 start_codon:yes stop_codon:yes gene_type:complete
MTTQISKVINYTKLYDQAVWSVDCLYCRLHQPEKAIDTWYDCDECNSEFTQQPPEYILKQRYKMKLIRNALVVPQANPIMEQPANIIIETSQDPVTEDIVQIKPFFYIKGINQLNEFMKSGRKYLEKNLGIKFEKDFCKSLVKKEYDGEEQGMEDLVFKIDFSKSRPTTKRGGYFLHILLSGKYSLDELIGLSITNNLDKIQ